MFRTVLIWSAFAAAILIPAAIAATSPQLQWRGPVYIAAGFAGILAMGALLAQPVLAGGNLPGLNPRRTRRLHAISGAILLGLVVLHVAGLWWTSPPDVIDALTFTSPTPFSDWGVVAMWAVFLTSMLALFRRRLRLRPVHWRSLHLILAVIIIVGSTVHALLIEGTMETVSKAILCGLVIIASVRILVGTKPWRSPAR